MGNPNKRSMNLTYLGICLKFCVNIHFTSLNCKYATFIICKMFARLRTNHCNAL